MNRSESVEMRGPIAWMARNSVTANLLVLAILVGGWLFSYRIKKEVFPQIEIDEVSITVAYPGASPAEVEQSVVLALEEAVRNLDGVKQVESVAAENMAQVTVELETGADKNKALSDVKNAVDRITSFPLEIERPVVMLPEWKTEAISVVLFGQQEEKVLFELAEQVRAELLGLQEVNNVELIGVRPLEIDIEIPQQTLRRYDITLPEVAAIVRRTALELPAGMVKTDAGDVLLRTTERRNLGQEFASIPVLNAEDGTPVRLGDIANIVDGFSETDVEAYFEGQPSVMLRVYAVGEQSPTDVAAAVKNFVERLKPRLPLGIAVATWNDNSEIYQDRLSLLIKNAFQGLIIVLLLLGLFLDLKLAFWVTMGIPVSFLGALIFLPSADVTINMMTLFGFIIVLGMVVDDAIVTGEQIYHLRQQGMSFLDAAIQGARRMASPVFFSVATTLAAFFPLLFIPGPRGKWMYPIPVVVIAVLTVSLCECFFVLPAHLAHSRPPRPGSWYEKVNRLQALVARGLEKFVERYYAPVVTVAVRRRWITLATGIAVFLVFWGMWSGGRIKFVDFPREESDWVFATAALPVGSPVERTRQVMKRLVDAAHQVIEENGGPGISTGIYSMVGVAFDRRRQSQGSHLTSVVATLVPSDQRPIGASAFADKWRQKLGDIPGLESLSFQSTTGRGGFKPIDIELSHRDVSILEKAAEELAAELRGFEGVKDVETGIELGKPQLDFKLTPQAVAAGLTTYDLATQVRAAFYGAEALRQQRGRNELRVMVRLPREERRQLHTIDQMMVKLPGGGEMPLEQAAEIRWGRAYTSIQRTDGKRTLRVKADVEEERANAQEVMGTVFRRVLPAMQARYPGLGFQPAGRQRDMQEFFDYLKFAFLMVIIGVFAMIAIPLKSYAQPLFVVMIAIPFGFVGALLGHLVMGLDMSLISLMGVVAAAGVVVNDSIVLTDAANELVAQGLSPEQAAVESGKRRFRPVLLTSLTTFGGLATLIFETSLQARMMIPMAVSLGFGVMFATLVTLFITPANFTILENIRLYFRRRREQTYQVLEKA